MDRVQTDERISGRSETATYEPLRVLLVEDNPGDVLIVREVLSSQGADRYLVDHVSRLDAAMARLSEARYDLVLLDLSLPDGYGSFTLECAATFARELPVIVLTGIDDDRLALSAIQAGAEDYFLKNKIEGGLLASMIDRVIERRRRMDRLHEFVSKRGISENDGLYDAATGLISRPLFRDRLEHAIAQSERSGRAFSLIVLRINQYQSIFDSLGETVSSELMRSAADCLATRVRRSDTLARISSDSFGLVLDGLVEPFAVNSTVGALILSLGSVAASSRGEISVSDMTASIGVSVHPEHGGDADLLMDHASRLEFTTAHIGGDSNVSPVTH